MKHKFKEGDKVRIKDTSNVRMYCKHAVGKFIILTKKEAKDINDSPSISWFTLAENFYGVNFILDDLELVKPNKRGKNPRGKDGKFKKRESMMFNGTCFIGIENPRFLDIPEHLTQEEIKKLKNLLKGMENL